MEKKNKSSHKAVWVWSALWKIWGKGDREEVYIRQCQECWCRILGISSLKMHFGHHHKGTPGSYNQVGSMPFSPSSSSPC